MAKQIVVVGSGKPLSREIEFMAEEVGREIAKAGAVLISGGMGGVMEAACRGAKSENGLTVGILPRMGDESNSHLDVKIPTNLGYARNAIVAISGDALIVINGALGTLTEIAYAAAFSKKIIILETSEGITNLTDQIFEIPEVREETDRLKPEILKAKTPREAVELALK